MKSAVVAFALASGAQAFVPPVALPKVVSSGSQLSMAGKALDAEVERSVALPFAAKPANLNGELVGDVGFDPFRFSDKGDLAFYRRAELKHGRVAMLGVVGALIQESYSLYPDAPLTTNLFKSVSDAPIWAILQIIVFMGALDVQTTKYDIEKGRVPGDIGFDPLNLSKDGINEKWALAELKHGRLAMWAMAGFLVQQLVEPNQSILSQTFEWAKSFG